MKRIISYFWHNIKSSFKHKVGEYYTNENNQRRLVESFYNVWTDKISHKTTLIHKS